MNNFQVSSFGESNSEYPSRFRPLTRERLSYTRYQLDLLNAIFHHIPYPNSIQKEIIAKRVGITTEQVKVWFQNRRRKEVIQKERPDHDKRVSKNSGKTTLPVSSSTTSPSLVPSVILVSIVQELKQLTENKEKKLKLKRKAESSRNPPSSPNSSTDRQPLLKPEKTNSISSKKHSIYFSVFDIKSPPNQITPTVAFNLRSDLYRGPLEAFSAQRLNPQDSLTIMEIQKRNSFQISSEYEDRTFENFPPFPPEIKVPPFPCCSSIMRSSSYCASDLVTESEMCQSPFSAHCIIRDPLLQISTRNITDSHLKTLSIPP